MYLTCFTRKTVVWIGLIVCSALRTVGQTTASTRHGTETQQRLKTAFEQALSGTDIRDLHCDFEIRFDTLMQRFLVDMDRETPLAARILDSLHRQINRTLTDPSATYTGHVYFDRYTDRALVDIAVPTTDLLFQAAAGFIKPTGGMEAFSRRLHDFLKTEIDRGRITIDQAANLPTTSLIVERDGSLFSLADTPLSTSLEAFIAQEGHWSPGIWSGRPLIYELEVRLYTDYLRKTSGWPAHAEWKTRRLLSWEKRDGQFLLSSTNRPDVPLLSFIYDGTQRQYRFPVPHSGSREAYRQLITDIQENADRPYAADGTFYRVYFYWK